MQSQLKPPVLDLQITRTIRAAVASMTLALLAHNLGVQLSVCSVSACWRSGLGLDTPSRYLAIAGRPVITIVIEYAAGRSALLAQDLVIPLKAGDALLVEDVTATQQHLLPHPKVLAAD